jgi:hypothetical protein
MAASWLLTACSPAVNSAVAIGYDDQGRLIGAVRVCDGDVVQADLAPSTPEGADSIGSWRRTSPLEKGTETWLLEAGESGPWESVGPTLPALASETEYLFGASNENVSASSHTLVFRGRDLAKLRPGEVLVVRLGPTDANGETEIRLLVRPLDQMSRERCDR